MVTALYLAGTNSAYNTTLKDKIKNMNELHSGPKKSITSMFHARVRIHKLTNSYLTLVLSH